MKSTNDNQTLISLERVIATPLNKVKIDGKSLTIQEIVSVAQHKKVVSFTDDKETINRIDTCYNMMIDQVKKGIPIYGCNTGYGAQANHIVNEGTPKERLAFAKKISEGIVHTDVTVGPELPIDVIRAAMLIRINMLFQGVSAVRLQDLDILRQLINKQVTPVVNAFGGLGASGDLAHNSRVVSAMRQLPGIFAFDETGKKVNAAILLQKKQIPKLELEPKAGLGFVNGDNFSTAAAALIFKELIQLTLVADVTSAMTIEVLKGSNRTFHPFLSTIRPHKGQQELSSVYRYLLDGSRLAYQELTGQKERAKGETIQDAYSLRCITQSEGFNREMFHWINDTITINANSVSDNPLWVTPDMTTEGEDPWQWVSGGNFFAQHMGEVLDSMRKIMTRLIKRNDRQLHRMLNKQLSNGLPPNLSHKDAISQCAFKGIQLESGMFDVYSMLLVTPATTHFGIHEENNQDITPHSLTSAIFAWELLKVLRYSLSINLLAVTQAVEFRGGKSMLSTRTKPMYSFIRELCKPVEQERPLGPDIELVQHALQAGTVSDMVRTQIFADYEN